MQRRLDVASPHVATLEGGRSMPSSYQWAHHDGSRWLERRDVSQDPAQRATCHRVRERRRAHSHQAKVEYSSGDGCSRIPHARRVTTSVAERAALRWPSRGIIDGRHAHAPRNHCTCHRAQVSAHMDRRGARTGPRRDPPCCKRMPSGAQLWCIKPRGAMSPVDGCFSDEKVCLVKGALCVQPSVASMTSVYRSVKYMHGRLGWGEG